MRSAGDCSFRSLPAFAAIEGDRRPIGTGRYGALSPNSHIRPQAACPSGIQIAVIQPKRYAICLLAWTELPHYGVGSRFTCCVIAQRAQFTFLNSYLQTMLSGIPMLCGNTVTLKQS